MAGDGVRRRVDTPQAEMPTTSTHEERVLKNRPKASALRQQRLRAWQPIMTATTVIPAVFCIGIVFIPIGVALYVASEGVNEVRVKYGEKCQLNQPCTVTFNVEEEMRGTVYFYYFLSNFYQNHRRYVKNRNDRQYLGNIDSVSECEPFDKIDGKYVVPCGAIANSMFNDTFTLFASGHSGDAQVQFTEHGVVWDVDETRKFKNPDGWTNQTSCAVYEQFNTIKPPNWSKKLCELPNAMQNVDFIVWMRTAALPSFRKLYRILSSSDPVFSGGLPAGTYVLHVENHYPVDSFGGTKEFIMSTTSWAGGKNGFLGVAYLVVGSLAILFGVIFIIIHFKFGHSVDELSNITAHQQ